MLPVPGGTLWQGSPEGQGEPDERPERKVEIAEHCLHQREVSVGEYQACAKNKACEPLPTQVRLLSPLPEAEHQAQSALCGANLADNADLPATCVSFEDATRYCAWKGLRLPTEAEWEWLARAGTTTAFAAGDLTARVCNADPALVPAAWYCGSFGVGETPGTRAVGTKAANPWGLSDLAGNVAEWCWDWYGDYRLLDDDGDGVVLDPAGPATGTQRVVRGGSWYGGSEDCRGAARDARYPDSADDTIGLRAVRTVIVD